MEQSNKKLEEQYPSVELAYDIALKSLDWQMNRLNAVDEGIERLMTWISSITIGAIALIVATIKDINFFSCWFYIFMTLFVVSIVIGIIMRTKGHIIIISPVILLNNWLRYSLWEFKKNMLYDMENYYPQNKKLINNKGYTITIMSIIFLVQMIILLIWIISASHHP